ncbi:MAG: hypothetical protein KGJ11_07290, partial [Candidatus Omnitrophica bacterium]|nr:hypothetical protein [Candidatus Omnitrophota bacterium]
MTFLVLILSFLMGGGSLALAAGARDQVLNAQLNAVEAQRVSTEAADQVNHVQAPPVQPANETIEPPLRPVGTNAPSHWVHDIFFSNRQP